MTNKINDHKPTLRTKEIFIFLGVFAFILITSHYYLFERISYYLQLTKGQSFFVAFLLGSFAFFTIIIIPVSRKLPQRVATIMAWAIYPWMGIALLMFVAFLVTDTVWLLLKLVPENYLIETHILQYYFGIAALLITSILGGLSFWKGIQAVTIKPIFITLNRLPSSFDGLRIAQITDLHISSLRNGNWLQRVVDKVNALKPDLIVITGDLVDGSVEELHKHVALLANLRAQYGVYFVTGNHEYYSGVEPWCAYVASLGVRVLRNERVSITSPVSNESFDLAGVDDWASHYFPEQGPDLSKALANRDPSKALILLAHQPAAVHEAAEQGVDLQLSGHTHGGQIWPFNYLVYLQQPYVKGLYRYKNTETQIYISSGTGFWGPPMRLGTSAEITCITLRQRDQT